MHSSASGIIQVLLVARRDSVFVCLFVCLFVFVHFVCLFIDPSSQWKIGKLARRDSVFVCLFVCLLIPPLSGRLANC